MNVELNLYASYRDYLPEGSQGNTARIELEEGATIGDLMKMIQLEEEKPKIIFKNSTHAKPESRLRDGDRVAVFPPVAGG
jgi:molybdopterin converting factor small subunit